ncbi:septum site-determining protein MinC [Thauera sp.]|uniref:septum site-determining protein MinC n=1 Tax=Thauera sp. TaxID=1905334 RepID=UPI001B4E3606|nr:septum site-determining protein MinC [Thauera sp.]MBP6132857.1 septum site-determining protein MinC [Thauera sp.]MBP7048402.1 septum site-determining protein MinC [Thauera sp.]
MSASAPARSIEFHNTTLGATIAVLQAAEPSTLADSLHKMLGGMPDFFSGELLILDFGGVAQLPERIDWSGLQSLLRRYRLQPIGVMRLAAEHHEGARRAGLALVDPAQLAARPPAEAPARHAAPAELAPAAAPPPLPPPVAAAATPTMFVERPLRSGQQIYARGTDLVLLGGVSPGAEVIADGSIHCYGPLRGRAIAGAQGNQAARIVASNFGPELVSIAGVYRTFERGIPEAFAGKPTLVRLNGTDHTLNLEALKLD